METIAPHPESAEYAGLSESEAVSRRAQYGPNVLPDDSRLAAWRILLLQFGSLMVAILLAAAIVSLLLGDWNDGIAICAILLLNVFLGFSQEYRAERAISKLRQLSVPLIRVRRDGALREISSTELVPGDLYLFDAGTVLPADGWLVSGAGVLVDESVLTGESHAISKLPGGTGTECALHAETVNATFAGTRVLKGRGAIVVRSTGLATELGKIAALMKAAPRPDTPLQKQLHKLSSRLALFVGAIALSYFVIGLFTGVGMKLMFLTAVSMAVAALPEGLPAVVTIILAAAGQRMLKRNALVRRLTAIEALGCVTAICSDKTGTLTENHMTLTGVWTAGDRVKGFLLACGALCNEATYSGSGEASSGTWLGDPLDVALAEAAAAGGIRKSALDASLPSVMEFPFDSERRAMTTVRLLDRSSSVALGWPLPDFPVDVQESAILEITKGAPESVSPACDSILTGSGVTALNETARREMALALEQFARSALRVVAIAFRFFPRGEEIPFPSTEGLTLAGLVGFLDPPRADSAPALAACRRAGIRVLMLTGDHPVTASAIAEQLGFAESSRLLTGAELSRLSTAELTEASRHVSIYARLNPEQKLWIVKALQGDGQIVAVTGDGVNDAPCLKTADLGIAMGQGGTDVARESASIVLRDNSFASIVAAIREGRVIFANIQRFVRYLFISNTGELAVMIFGPLLSMPMPLMPLQILWINLITDGLPALALGLAPPERDVMTQPPRPPSREIVDGGMTRSIAWNGLLLGAASLAAGYLCGRASQSHWQTAIFLTLGLSQLLLALALHSDTAPLPATIWANKSIVGAVLLCAILQFATMQWEPLRITLHTTLLSGPEIAICMAFSAVPLLAVEAGKWRGIRKGAVT